MTSEGHSEILPEHFISLRGFCLPPTPHHQEAQPFVFLLKMHQVVESACFILQVQGSRLKLHFKIVAHFSLFPASVQSGNCSFI